jgi:DMSO/TMAO reductase YedYZ molybdopterin-dependent catalytic subunit
MDAVESRDAHEITQITMHNCDEGWSAIGQWTGVQLGHVLSLAGLRPEARYVVFPYCPNTRIAPFGGL